MRRLLLTSIFASILGCGPNSGFHSSTESSTQNPLQDGPPGSTDPKADWNEIQEALAGQISGGVYSETFVLSVDKNRQALIFTLPFPAFLVPISAISISGLDGASIESATDANGMATWQVVIPLKYLIKGAKLQEQFNRLPNGDPLPGFPAGEVSGLAIQFKDRPRYRLNIYLGVSAAAVFVESPLIELPTDIFANLPAVAIRNKTNTQILGYFALVPQKNNSLGGLYISSRLPASVARKLDEVLRF